MDAEKTPKIELNDFLKDVAQANASFNATPEVALPDKVAAFFTSATSVTLDSPVPDLAPLVKAMVPVPNEQAQSVTSAIDSPAATPVSTSAPLLDLKRPAAPVDNEVVTSASKRPFAHFGQAAPATKSKANRKLVLQLTPEQYQYFAHVATLPGLDGVALPDLALAILQAWREDYRPEIKRANAAFKA